jgi:hypothetical protein
MEQHQLVYRSKQPGKTKKSPGGAAAGATHACHFFKTKGKCKHGDVTGCAAGIHDSRKPFESKAVGQDARKKWGTDKGKGGGGGKGNTPTHQEVRILRGQRW